MACTGYLRVSTNTQDLEKDKQSVLAYANQHHLGHVSWVEEVISSRVPWRQRKVAQVVDSLLKGDDLVTPEISRIGRSIMEVMTILSILMEKGVKVHVIKGNWVFDGSLQSKVLATVFSLAAELERSFISERTKVALKAHQQRGIKLGRPVGPSKSKLDRHREEIERMLQDGSTKIFIAKKFRTTPANLSIWMRKRGISREKVA